MTHQNTSEKKAYALGIIGRELNVDFDNKDISADEWNQINEILEDVLLDEPKTEIGKNIKKAIEEEKENKESEYNKAFNFSKDLNENKIRPATIFIFQLLAKYAERLVDKDEDAKFDMLAELVEKLNELQFPVGYIDSPFNVLLADAKKLNTALQGQMKHREDEIKALSIGIRHPKYETLSPHLASFAQMDTAIKTLRETFNFTEEDYRK